MIFLTFSYNNTFNDFIYDTLLNIYKNINVFYFFFSKILNEEKLNFFLILNIRLKKLLKRRI